jgi:formamidase
MSRLLGIAGVQMEPIPGNAWETFRKMEMLVHEIGLNYPWVQLILFHELVVPGLAKFYLQKPGEKNLFEAQTIPGPLSEALCDLARREKRWLVPGSMYEIEGNSKYNTALVISPAGDIVAKYRKMFRWLPYEDDLTPGDQFCVFDIPEVGKFGLCICYDMYYPEVIRTLVWMGAEVILHPTFTPTSDRSLELILSQANAIMNQCYFIDINGVNTFGGGKSILVDPDGRVLQQAGDHEAILTEIIDLEHVTRTREYGTIGLTQTLKQLRDCDISFPIYTQGIKNGAGFKNLKPLKLHNRLK